MTALVTSPIAREVASCGSECSMAICRCTFSITTMASSTTRPVASVMPNSVSELMEKPKILMKANVPISETGMVTAGMMVARQSSRNRKITTMTITMASARVTSTSRIESPTTVVESNAMAYCSPGGKLFDSLDHAAFACRSTASALAFGQLLHADAHRLVPGVLQQSSCSPRRPPPSGQSFSSTSPFGRVLHDDVVELGGLVRRPTTRTGI